VTSDFRPQVEIRPFRACVMHWNSSFIMDVAMGQIPRFTERISSLHLYLLFFIPLYAEIRCL